VLTRKRRTDMSLDIWARCPVCNTSAGDGHNITHNVVPMWKACGIYEALYKSEGRNCGEVADELEHGVMVFVSRIEEMRELNPENGWGDADRALSWLRAVIRDFREHDKCVVHIWS
jgi:hypothetical protein